MVDSKVGTKSSCVLIALVAIALFVSVCPKPASAAVFYEVYFQSKETGVPPWKAQKNLGKVELWKGGNVVGTYSLPRTLTLEAGYYVIQYFPSSGYVFVQWKPSGGKVTVDDPFASKTGLEVLGAGKVIILFKKA